MDGFYPPIWFFFFYFLFFLGGSEYHSGCAQGVCDLNLSSGYHPTPPGPSTRAWLPVSDPERGPKPGFEPQNVPPTPVVGVGSRTRYTIWAGPKGLRPQSKLGLPPTSC